MKRIWILSGFGLLVGLSAYLYMQSPISKSQVVQDQAQSNPKAANPPGAAQTDLGRGPTPEMESKLPTLAPDPSFQKWIADEAKSLNYERVDGTTKRQEIQRVVTQMTQAQSRQLLHTALNPNAPAAEKILSTYLLAEGGARSREELVALAKAPLSGKVGEPHSEEEVAGVREKSLRIMAIDGLFSDAQRDPRARASLASYVADAQDPFLKAYAQSKLAELDGENR